MPVTTKQQIKMTSLFKKINTPEDILHFLSSKTKNSKRLTTFAQQDFSTDNDRKKEKLAIEISAIANSGGGCIIIGLKTNRNIIKEASYVALDAFNTFTENELLGNISPNIHYQIKKIDATADHQGIIIIDIQNSGNAPHMAPDYKFYIKNGANTILLEENELRRFYRQGNTTELDVFAIQNTSGIPILENGKFKTVNFYPRFLIKNISNTVEDTFKIELFIPSAINNPNFDVLQRHFSRLEDIYTVYSIKNTAPLFQEELSSIVEAHFFINEWNFNIFEQHDIVVKLYYTNGSKERRFNLHQTFLYKNTPLLYNDFVLTAINGSANMQNSLF